MGVTHDGVVPGRHTFRARAGTAWALIKETVGAWIADNASSRAAALAYYSVFSLAPTLIIALSIAGALLGADAARGELYGTLQGVVGDSAARAVEQLVAGAARPGRSLAVTLVGVLVLTLAATGAFAELQNALNAFWKVPPDRTTGVRPFLKRRAISIAMVLAIGVLLLASVLASAALSAFGAWLAAHGAAAVELIDHLVSFGVITVLFAMIFKFLPDARVAWKDVWVGALVTSLLFNLGKVAIAIYLARSAFASAWGAAGAVVVLLAWVYYSSLILFLGAEFTQVFARRHGSRVPTSAHHFESTA